MKRRNAAALMMLLIMLAAAVIPAEAEGIALHGYSKSGGYEYVPERRFYP